MDFGSDKLVDLWQDCSNENGVWILGNLSGSSNIYKLDIVNNRLSIIDSVTGTVEQVVDIFSGFLAFDQPEIATGPGLIAKEIKYCFNKNLHSVSVSVTFNPI